MLNPHPDTYTVEAGDTVYSIACFYGDVSPEAIIAVNQLEEPYELTAGQTFGSLKRKVSHARTINKHVAAAPYNNRGAYWF